MAKVGKVSGNAKAFLRVEETLLRAGPGTRKREPIDSRFLFPVFRLLNLK